MQVPQNTTFFSQQEPTQIPSDLFLNLLEAACCTYAKQSSDDDDFLNTLNNMNLMQRGSDPVMRSITNLVSKLNDSACKRGRINDMLLRMLQDMQYREIVANENDVFQSNPLIQQHLAQTQQNLVLDKQKSQEKRQLSFGKFFEKESSRQAQKQATVTESESEDNTEDKKPLKKRDAKEKQKFQKGGPQWTQFEKEKLKAAVEKLGKENYTKIAEQFSNRTKLAIQSKIYKTFGPSIQTKKNADVPNKNQKVRVSNEEKKARTSDRGKKILWTVEETQQLVNAVKEYKKDYEIIAAIFENRSTGSIKAKIRKLAQQYTDHPELDTENILSIIITQ